MPSETTWTRAAVLISLASLAISIGTPFAPRLFNLKHEADLRVVTASVSGDDEGAPVLRVVLRNLGEQAAVVTDATYALEKRWEFQTVACSPSRREARAGDVTFTLPAPGAAPLVSTMRWGAPPVVPMAMVVGEGEATTTTASLGLLNPPANKSLAVQMRATFQYGETRERVQTPPLLLLLERGGSNPAYAECLSAPERRSAAAANAAMAKRVRAEGEGARTNALETLMRSVDLAAVAAGG